MVKRLNKIYDKDKIDYDSLSILEGILSEDYKTMRKDSFIAYYQNTAKVCTLFNEWLIPHNLGFGFVNAYLEYRYKIKYKPYRFKRYIVQYDYFDEYEDSSQILEVAYSQAIPCFRRHGFLYKEVS